MGRFSVYIAPVSGGGFPAQLGLLSELYSARFRNRSGKFVSSQDYTPDLCCGSSGGNVALYVGLAADWSADRIAQIASRLHADMFVRSWWPEGVDFFPTWLLGIFNGSLYRTGDGAGELLKSIFTPVSIQRTEMWTGLFNATLNVPEFFCNRAVGHTYVWPKTFNGVSNRVRPLTSNNFAAGNIDKISELVAGSASIPLLVKGPMIDGCRYSDGGSAFSSPIAVLSDEIYRNVAVLDPSEEVPAETVDTTIGTTGGLPRAAGRAHLYYFNSFNMDTYDTSWKVNALDQLVNSTIVQDRMAAISLLTRVAGGDQNSITHWSRNDMTTAQLAAVLAIIDPDPDTPPYDFLVYLAPKEEPCVEMDKFKGEDLLRAISQTQVDYQIQVWISAGDDATTVLEALNLIATT